MHQEFNADGLRSVGRKINLLVKPALLIRNLMEDRLQNGPIGIGDVSILIIDAKGVDGIIPVPEI
jgi:hypothetical protein